MNRNNVADLLLSIRCARNLTAHMSIEQISQAVQNLESILDKKTKKKLQMETDEAEKQEKYAIYLDLLKSDGISVEELVASRDDGQPSKRKYVRKTKLSDEPKYRIISQDGALHEWKGRGRMPLLFAQELSNQGGDIEKFKITQ
ncbi:H-NS family nucleoid-associated regulatory protein [Photobacterium kishitanii]|uniref:DNA-binding protein n=1 Tax=Photobacterium kishitanii TaxID=318456 RepID=A0A2T3KM68_9GAMM|nr:H-NS family nucleoid-associated regulatory protein [Photobacterium kishitanii]PSV00874.1 hypothetical protein C9J27_02275 [Photobacterium kishitanii]